MKIPALSNFQFLIFKFQIFLFLLLASCYLLLVTPVSAQSQTNPYTVPNTTSDVPKNLHTWTQNVMIEVMSAMSCQLTGIDPTNPKSQCLGVDTKTGKIGFVQGGGGAIGVAGKMIAMLYTPPLHTGDYFKYLAGHFGIAKPAYAAGFEGLKPIQSLWVAFRNIVYLLFVIVFVVIGLAIMLRVRIDPRTVMTIQNQIPRIIIGILLVTFSFAIAGFLIDLMYVVIFLSYELISGAVTPGLLDKLNPLYLQNSTPFTAAQELSKGGLFGILENTGKSLYVITKELIGNGISTFIQMIIPVSNSTRTIGEVVIGAVGTLLGVVTLNPIIILASWAPLIGDKFFAGGFGDNLLAGITAVIVSLIIGVAILISLIRLWIALLMAYIAILLAVVFAPFWIVAGLLPGVPAGFGGWARNIIANLAAFPAVIIMFLLAKVFIDSFGGCKLPGCDPKAVFVPPLVGSLPGTDVIGSLIALGIIFMTPNVVAMVKAALKAPQIQTGPIVAAIAGGTRVVTGTVGGGIAARMASQEYIPASATGGFKKRGTTGAIFGRLFGR